MSRTLDVSVHTELPLLIAIVDLTRYTARARSTPDAGARGTNRPILPPRLRVRRTRGGRVVKFMGDAALIVFPEDLADAGIRALLALKQEVESWLDGIGWDSRLVVRAHFDRCVAGPYGEERRFDVIGSAVNTAARLPSASFALSAQAFRKLLPETRRGFKKHTPPLTYIRLEDTHADSASSFGRHEVAILGPGRAEHDESCAHTKGRQGQRV